MNPQEIDPYSLPFVLLENKSKLPDVSCIYFAIDASGVIHYIGLASNARSRWIQHHRAKQLRQIQGVKIAYLECPVEILKEVEKALIFHFNPSLNNTRVPEIERLPIKEVCALALEENELVVNSTVVRRRFGEYLQKVVAGGIILIQMFDRSPGGDQSGDIVAVIISKEEYDRLKSLEQSYPSDRPPTVPPSDSSTDQTSEASPVTPQKKTDRIRNKSTKTH